MVTAVGAFSLSKTYALSLSFRSREECGHSRQELFNAYLVAKIGLGTAENGPLKVEDRGMVVQVDEQKSSGDE